MNQDISAGVEDGMAARNLMSDAEQANPNPHWNTTWQS